MKAHTTMSAKGQAVIPKDVRDAMHLRPGQPLDVLLSGEAIILRPASRRSGQSVADVTERIRRIAAAYKGSAVSVEDMNETIAGHRANSGSRGAW
ncbi:MAG: AbrB family transcriptional regulator [Sphingomonas taxi]|uniref:AbrB family transcriptional regulator n=1 Tax=Sphingomonas taxi TaxID=1549858 RepID=A0A2W5P8R1_9SPHN|nr:MAG: AbrB family transcriptional regulator [Sphingomonas taxi]